MKKKIAKVSAASLITLSMTVGNVTAINGINDTNEAETNENEEILENKTQETNSVSGENAIQNDTTNQQNSETETSVDSKSEEKSLEDREVIGKTTFVDENGNVKEVEVRDGTTGETYNPNARTVSTANMVNFNCSAADSVITYTDYNIGQSGYLSKASAADAAFLGYENGKVKFMVSGVVGLVDANKVEVVSQGTYYASNYEVNSKGMLYHYISNNVNATGNQGNYNYVGVAPSYLQKGIEYYSYDGHYFYTDYNVMINDYKNNVRSNSVNANNPYYNYFQYLPLRSKTNYSGAQLTSYLNNKANSSTSKLNNTGDLFVKYQEKNGVNALLAASVAALESGWGKSSIAINKNNLFGLNAADSNPGEAADTFASVEACISDFTENWMSERYLNAEYTSRYRGGYFGDKGSGIFGQYSSDVYEGEKCASIAANMDSGITSADLNYYTIGIKDASSTTYTGLAVKKEANDSSATLYTTIKNPAYAFIVRKKALNNGYYEVQSDSSLTSDRNDVSGNGEYNFSNNYGYVKSNSLPIVNTGNDVTYPSNSINQAPVITDAKITNVSKNGYTVTCKVTDDGSLDRVQMPTWSENGGQDDLIWYTATKSGDTYTINVKTSDHKNDTGKYFTHIYAYDNEGKYAVVTLEAEIPENKVPTITDVKVSEVTSQGYRITFKADDPDGKITKIEMPTWTDKNWQDDIKWYAPSKSGDTYTLLVKTSNHKYESGRYHTHIYVYDDSGSKVGLPIDSIEVPEAGVPTIKDIKISDVDRSGYTVTCTVESEEEIDRVEFPTWTEKTGQDDIIYARGTVSGTTVTYRVNTKDHNGESGVYNTHIYAYTKSGKKCGVQAPQTTIVNDKPEISDVEIEVIDTDSYKVTCYVNDFSDINKVQFPTWTEKNGQDDLVWHEGTVEGNIASIIVNREDHNFEYNRYNTHIYAYDDEGLANVYATTIDLEEPDLSEVGIILKDVEITDANDDGYTVNVTVLSNSEITKVEFPTWTYKNDQDDLIRETGQKNGNVYSYRVNRSDHNYEFGAYITHIYAYTADGQVKGIPLPIHNIVNTTVRQGWAYINGQKYFFDNAGNIAGNMPAKKIIDVSSYNGNIDWDTVKQYGDIDGAILRITAHPNGYYIEDTQFARNLAECRRLNIPFGVYIYDYANNTNDAVYEANFVINILRKYNVSPSELSYPVYYDLERTQISKEQNIANMNAFISTMNASGYTAHVYSYRAMLNDTLNDPRILANVSWMAAYTNTIGWSNPYYKGNFGWQYTSSGSIPGISGNVDISCWYVI